MRPKTLMRAPMQWLGSFVWHSQRVQIPTGSTRAAHSPRRVFFPLTEPSAGQVLKLRESRRQERRSTSAWKNRLAVSSKAPTQRICCWHRVSASHQQQNWWPAQVATMRQRMASNVHQEELRRGQSSAQPELSRDATMTNEAARLLQRPFSGIECPLFSEYECELSEKEAITAAQDHCSQG